MIDDVSVGNNDAQAVGVNEKLRANSFASRSPFLLFSHQLFLSEKHRTAPHRVHSIIFALIQATDILVNFLRTVWLSRRRGWMSQGRGVYH